MKIETDTPTKEGPLYRDDSHYNTHPDTHRLSQLRLTSGEGGSKGSKYPYVPRSCKLPLTHRSLSQLGALHVTRSQQKQHFFLMPFGDQRSKSIFMFNVCPGADSLILIALVMDMTVQ
jgi:hypothetical protein